MQKINQGLKDQTLFNPHIRLTISVFRVSHWSNARIRPGLISSPWIRFFLD